MHSSTAPSNANSRFVLSWRVLKSVLGSELLDAAAEIEFGKSRRIPLRHPLDYADECRWTLTSNALQWPAIDRNSIKHRKIVRNNLEGMLLFSLHFTANRMQISKAAPHGSYISFTSTPNRSISLAVCCFTISKLDSLEGDATAILLGSVC